MCVSVHYLFLEFNNASFQHLYQQAKTSMEMAGLSPVQRGSFFCG